MTLVIHKSFHMVSVAHKMVRLNRMLEYRYCTMYICDQLYVQLCQGTECKCCTQAYGKENLSTGEK